MLRRQRNADAGADIELLTVDLVGCRHGLEESARERHDRLPLILRRRGQDGEFVTAQSCHRIGLADTMRQPARHQLQQLVADRMAERIVD